MIQSLFKVFGVEYDQQVLIRALCLPAAPPSEDEVLGAMSIIFWAMTLILLVKYQLVVLNADDHGEGMPNWRGDPLSLCVLHICSAH